MSSIPPSESKVELLAPSKTAVTNEIDHSTAKLRPIFGALEGKATLMGDIVQSEFSDEDGDRL